MAIHRGDDRHFFTIGGAVKTEGGSLKLAKGQFGIFNVGETTVDGATAVSNFLGQPKDAKFELRLGRAGSALSRTENNKSYSSFPFCVGDVKGLSVSSPDSTEQSVDEVIIGYNGIDCETSINFQTGDRYRLVLELSGEPIGLLGYANATTRVEIVLEAEDCSPYGKDCVECDPCAPSNCKPIILRAIKQLRNYMLKGNVPLSAFIDVTPIFECKPEEEKPDLIPYKWYCLTVCDTGDDTALALVAAQYPKYKVYRKDRVGANSTYEFLAPGTDDAPEDYEQTLPSIMKGCEDCPPEYEETEAGYVYAVCLEDDGVDEASTVEGLANAIAGTGVKAEAQSKGA